MQNIAQYDENPLSTAIDDDDDRCMKTGDAEAESEVNVKEEEFESKFRVHVQTWAHFVDVMRAHNLMLSKGWNDENVDYLNDPSELYKHCKSRTEYFEEEESTGGDQLALPCLIVSSSPRAGKAKSTTGKDNYAAGAASPITDPRKGIPGVDRPCDKCRQSHIMCKHMTDPNNRCLSAKKARDKVAYGACRTRKVACKHM